MDIKSILLSKAFLLLVLAVGLLGWVCYDGLSLMVNWWERDEYSHGYMIPMVALYLLWQKRFVLAEHAGRGSYAGLLLLVAALAIQTYERSCVKGNPSKHSTQASYL